MTREEIIRNLKYTMEKHKNDTVNTFDTNISVMCKDILDYLEQEPKTGHWVDIKNHHYYNDGDIETTELRCSCCNEIVEWDIESLHKPYYCENCGAKIEGGGIV